MPMTICEEAIDISYLGTLEAAGLSEAIGSTKVGELRKELEKKCERLLMSVLCGEDVSGDTRGLQSDREESEDPGGSIFDHGSRMGLIPGEDVDHWLRDEVTATWTRVIRVPRRSMYHPSEGIADQVEGLSLEERGPVLSTLRSARMTIPEKGGSIRDDWRTSSEEDLMEDYWVGRCVFYEDWAEASTSHDRPVAQVLNLMQGMKAVVETDKKAEMPNGLVFQDLYEYSLIDDLTGKPLDPSLVTIAKHEEIMEMYRRTVWVERPTTDCIRDTGKSPIPVRWVSTNKGDELHPNVRCRLVAKHLVANWEEKMQKTCLLQCHNSKSRRRFWSRQCK